MKDKILLIIPVKGDSRRLPKKWRAELVPGVTLLDRAMDRCQDFEVLCEARGDALCFSVVVTESSEVMDYIKVRGGKYVGRPKELAVEERLHATMSHVVGEFPEFTTLMVTLPTSPLATSWDLMSGYKMFASSGRQRVMSMTNVGQMPHWCLRKRRGRLTPSAAETVETWYWWNDMGLEDMYKCNGAVYVTDVEDWKEKPQQYVSGLLCYEMPPERGVDVDTELDLLLAQAIYRRDYGEKSDPRKPGGEGVGQA